ncbi:MAG: leucine-rich repeat domain-containing protein [Oscillospiraceae bacterium]|nr:leucine-rich repeat domain-containing protein [Oscillospiraceae bacterium]
MKKINLLKKAVLLCLCISLSVSAFANKPYVFADDFTELTELTDPTDPTELTELTYSTNSAVLYSGTITDADWAWEITDDWVLTITINPGGATGLSSWSGMTWSAYASSIKEIKLPEGLISIGENAFPSYANLEEVYFPSTLEAIGSRAFVNGGLKTLNLSNTKVETIGANAFHLNRRLETIDFPPSLKTIGTYAFFECPAVETIDFSSGLESIGELAFAMPPPGGGALTDLDLSKTSLESVGKYAFQYRHNLENVNLSNNQIKTIEDYAFHGCSSIQTLTFPTTLETIGNYAFASAMAGKLSLYELDLSNTKVATIGASAFESSEIERLVLPTTIKFIDNGAFSLNSTIASSSKLETITYPGGRDEVGVAVFPDSLETIVNYAFSFAAIREVDLSKNTNLTGLPNNCFTYNPYLETVILPEHPDFTTLGNHAFAYTPRLEDIFIPPNVTTLPENTFIRNSDVAALDLIYIFAEYGSYAANWAADFEANFAGSSRNDFLWFYRADPIALSEQPPSIYQYVPFEFSFNTGVPLNRNMIFEIEFGANGNEPLPEWLNFKTYGIDHTKMPANEYFTEEEITPGTLWGVFTDEAEIAKYNGKPFKITAYPFNHGEGAPDKYKNRYSVSVAFNLELEAHPDGEFTSGEFDFKEGGTLGDEGGNIEVEVDGTGKVTSIKGSRRMYMEAPFSRDGKSWHFHKFYINGKESDGFEAEEGSTIVTIRDQTFAELGDGDHTATATFRRADGDSGVNSMQDLQGNAWDVRVQSISQSFTINPNANPQPDPKPQPQPNPQPDSQNRSPSNRNTNQNQPQPDQQANAENETPVAPVDNTAQNTDSSPNPTPNPATEPNPTTPTPPVLPTDNTNNTESNNNTENTSGNNTDDPETQNPPVENSRLSTEGNTVNPTGGAVVTPMNQTIADDERIQSIISGLGVDDEGNYYFISDENGTPLKVRIDIPLDEFIELYIDGTLLTRDLDYTATEGSTIIEISAERLSEFGNGSRTINAVFLNETVNITFDIILPAPQVQMLEAAPSVPAVAVNEVQGVEAVSGYSDAEKSGNSVVIAFCVLIVLAGGVAGFLIVKRRRES